MQKTSEIQPISEVFVIHNRRFDANLKILIIGESGVGKEPLAKEIYNLSTKSDAPTFVAR